MRWRSRVTYAIAGSKCEASICVTRLQSGKPGGVTVSQCAPPSRVPCSRPGSLPAQIRPALNCDAATATAAGRGRDVLCLTRSFVKSRERATSVADIENVRIASIDRDIAALRAADGKPVARVDLAVVRAGYHRGRSAVLLRCVHGVG